MSVTTLDTTLTDLTTPVHRRRRLLLVAYNFPPVGGAGVQRPVKWVKYLRRFGWDVTVLTTENPSVPVRDQSLLADLPDDVTIVRARTWEPDYRVKQGLNNGSSETSKGMVQRAISAAKGFVKRGIKLALQPDPQVLWNPNALRAGAAALREQPHDAILVTAPAYSSFFIGASLKRRFGLPLILDYRDEWDLSGKYLENAQHDWFSRTVQSRMQSSLLRQADAVVATTRLSTSNLADKLVTLRHSVPAVCIYNGFDAEDFAESQSKTVTHANHSTADALRIVYTGTLWNLTDIEPLVKGIEALNVSNPELLRKLELICVGRKTPEQQRVLNRVQTTSARVESIDYCAHTEVLDWLYSADAACLLLSDVPGAERVIPAKLFEYLAIRKDLLAITPAGETADIVRRFFPSGHFVPDDTAGIASWLASRLSGETPLREPPPHNPSIDEFSRETQASKLAGLLNSVVSSCHQ